MSLFPVLGLTWFYSEKICLKSTENIKIWNRLAFESKFILLDVLTRQASGEEKGFSDTSRHKSRALFLSSHCVSRSFFLLQI